MRFPWRRRDLRDVHREQKVRDQTHLKELTDQMQKAAREEPEPASGGPPVEVYPLKIYNQSRCATCYKACELEYELPEGWVELLWVKRLHVPEYAVYCSPECFFHGQVLAMLEQEVKSGAQSIPADVR